jgi:hypothetical protein
MFRLKRQAKRHNQLVCTLFPRKVFVNDAAVLLECREKKLQALKKITRISAGIKSQKNSKSNLN